LSAQAVRIFFPAADPHLVNVMEKSWLRQERAALEDLEKRFLQYCQGQEEKQRHGQEQEGCVERNRLAQDVLQAPSSKFAFKLAEPKDINVSKIAKKNKIPDSTYRAKFLAGCEKLEDKQATSTSNAVKKNKISKIPELVQASSASSEGGEFPIASDKQGSKTIEGAVNIKLLKSCTLVQTKVQSTSESSNSEVECAAAEQVKTRGASAYLAMRRTGQAAVDAARGMRDREVAFVSSFQQMLSIKRGRNKEFDKLLAECGWTGTHFTSPPNPESYLRVLVHVLGPGSRFYSTLVDEKKTQGANASARVDAPNADVNPGGAPVPKSTPVIAHAHDVSSASEGVVAKAKKLPSISTGNAISSSEPITTLMIQNLMSEVQQQEVLEELNRSGFENLYDFCYLPCDFSKKVAMGLGFAFVNFVSEGAALMFMSEWHGSRRFGLEVALSICPASVQGYQENVNKWSVKALRRRNPNFRPFIVKKPDQLQDDVVEIKALPQDFQPAVTCNIPNTSLPKVVIQLEKHCGILQKPSSSDASLEQWLNVRMDTNKHDSVDLGYGEDADLSKPARPPNASSLPVPVSWLRDGLENLRAP